MSATSALHQITAPIRYIVAGETAVFYPADRGKSHWPADDHDMPVTDLRTVSPQPTVERNGFAMLKHTSTVKNFFDPDEVQNVFLPEVSELAKKVNGAVKAIAFGPMARSDDPAVGDGRLPSFGAHIDYGRQTTEDQARLLLGDEADYWLGKRFVLMNFWRPIQTVRRCPLALCDASTVLANDMHPSIIYGGLGDPNRPPLYGFNLSYNPAHQWYYVSNMQPDEVFAFKLYDSDPEAVQWTGHTAIEDPETAPDAPARQSMEVRTISFIDD
ncbi:MAG: hypothetical protein H6978_13560 [Gammaproteobacteria bacterium]|nr:hypothetical protein [Gammaproteobacteria bacterium]